MAVKHNPPFTHVVLWNAWRAPTDELAAGVTCVVSARSGSAGPGACQPSRGQTKGLRTLPKQLSSAD
jgi:hypothetical protein